MYLWTVLFVVQLNFFISYGYLLSCFNNVSDSEHCELNEILVERSIFQYNIQKSLPRSLQLKKNVILKNRNVYLRLKISKTNTSRDYRHWKTKIKDVHKIRI